MLNRTPGAAAEDIDSFESIPSGRSYRTAQFPGIGAGRWNALENLSVLEVIKRFKVKNDGPAAKTAKQTNPLHERAFLQPAMR